MKKVRVHPNIQIKSDSKTDLEMDLTLESLNFASMKVVVVGV